MAQNTGTRTGQRRPARSTPTRESGEVESAVRAQLAEVAKRDPTLARSPLAAMALSRARDIDDPMASATSKSMNNKELRETLKELRELAPPDEKETPLDDIRRRHAARLTVTKS